MAVLRHFSIKNNPLATLKYITGEIKAQKAAIVTGINCSDDPESAYIEMKMCYEHYSGEKFHRVGNPTGKEHLKMHHYVISFKGQEVTPQEADRIAQEWAKEVFGDNFQILIATHIDTKNIHVHVAVNAFDMNGKRWLDNKKTMNLCREKINAICKKKKLNVIENPKYNTRQNYAEWLANRNGTSWKHKLCDDIDKIVLMEDIHNMDEFIRRLAMHGYYVRKSKYISVRPSDMENIRPVRTLRLGDGYGIEELQYRIENKNREMSLDKGNTAQTIENQEEKWYNIVMNKQLTFSLISDELAQAKTSKKEFLEKIERIIPFDEWIGIIRPCYYKGEHGNKPYDLELMLRIFLLQNLYDLSDMKVMNEVIDSRAFSDFCGVDSPNQVPDGDTIGRFRNILVENGLQEKLFHQVIDILSEKSLILKRGTIVDSTLIAAPSSTKNKDKKRDKDAHSVKKGNQWHFGYKAHIGVDKDSGLVHHLKVTGANEHDVTATPDLMHGEEEELYGDSGYIGAEKRENAVVKNKNGRKIKYKINRKPSTMKKLSKSGQYAAKKAEHKKSSVRAKVEHVFAVVKRLFGYRKTRYRGLRKQTAKLNIMFALANLYLADRKSLTA